MLRLEILRRDHFDFGDLRQHFADRVDQLAVVLLLYALPANLIEHLLVILELDFGFKVLLELHHDEMIGCLPLFERIFQADNE